MDGEGNGWGWMSLVCPCPVPLFYVLMSLCFNEYNDDDDGDDDEKLTDLFKWSSHTLYLNNNSYCRV